MIGTVVGNYRVLERVSVGGMGTIFRAEHALIGRTAAIKVLHPELSSNRDIVYRFFNEAKATTAIKHPGIVEIFDFGYLPSGDAYIVMEFLDGVTLAQRIKSRGVMAEGEAAIYLRGVCTALAAAHAKAIVHRDLKPDNIFLVPDLESPLGERVKLLDFGIAKLTAPGVASSATRTGAVLGTPTYMSPEQCKGSGEVDHRADLYSIGCMYYEMVSGRPPFVSYGAGELIGQHLFVAPEPLSLHAPTVSREVEALVMCLLEKQPEARVQSARELTNRLTAIAQQYAALPLGTPYDLSDAASLTPFVPTPIGQPRAPTPAPLPMPMVTPAYALETTIQPPAPPRAPGQPTTLSGTASQLELTAPRRRSRAGIAIGFVGAVVVAAVAIVATTAETGTTAPGAAAKQPAPAELAPAPATRPAPEPKPAPAPPPAPEAPPARPTEPTAAAAPEEPEAVKPAAPAPPTTTKPRPRPKPPAPAKPAQPARPKPEPVKDPLLETDL